MYWNKCEIHVKALKLIKRHYPLFKYGKYAKYDKQSSIHSEISSEKVSIEDK